MLCVCAVPCDGLIDNRIGVQPVACYWILLIGLDVTCVWEVMFGFNMFTLYYRLENVWKAFQEGGSAGLFM